MYLVTPEMLAELAGECVGVTMYTAISSQGVLRLWPVRLPGPDGKDLAHACGASLLARSPEWLLSRKAAANADMPSRLSVTGRSTIWSGRIVARTGLRMMPTFPRSPLTFRKASFPRYG
jgi:hypothetical protein